MHVASWRGPFIAIFAVVVVVAMLTSLAASLPEVLLVLFVLAAIAWLVLDRVSPSPKHKGS